MRPAMPSTRLMAAPTRTATDAIRAAAAAAPTTPAPPKVTNESATLTPTVAAISIASCASISMTSLCASSTASAYSVHISAMSATYSAVSVTSDEKSATAVFTRESSALLSPETASSDCEIRRASAVKSPEIVVHVDEACLSLPTSALGHIIPTRSFTRSHGPGVDPASPPKAEGGGATQYCTCAGRRGKPAAAPGLPASAPSASA